MSVQMARLSSAEAQSLITEWQAAVGELLDTIEQWVQNTHGAEWQISRSYTDVEEDSLGLYRIPMLEIQTQAGRLILEPVARDVIGARGRVDLYAWPSLYRVMLLRRSSNEAWVARTDSGIDWPQEWGEETFLALAGSLLKAA